MTHCKQNEHQKQKIQKHEKAINDIENQYKTISKDNQWTTKQINQKQ